MHMILMQKNMPPKNETCLTIEFKRWIQDRTKNANKEP